MWGLKGAPRDGVYFPMLTALPLQGDYSGVWTLILFAALLSLRNVEQLYLYDHGSTCPPVSNLCWPIRCTQTPLRQFSLHTYRRGLEWYIHMLHAGPYKCHLLMSEFPAMSLQAVSKDSKVANVPVFKNKRTTGKQRNDRSVFCTSALIIDWV